MSCKAFRRTAATLLVSMLAVLACAAPSYAAGRDRHRGSDDPGPSQPLQVFFSFLLQLVECAGGGIDPNGLQ